MDYQIIVTLGPSSNSEPVWRSLLSAGATAFRLNTSHLSLEGLETWMNCLAPFLSVYGMGVPLVLDLQGSKWRLGNFSPFYLKEGQQVELVYAPLSGSTIERAGVLPVPHEDFFRAAPMSGGEITLNDAKIHLVMEAAGSDWLRARIIQGGEIAPHKGITFLSCEYRQEKLSDKDQQIIEQTGELEFVRYAISYVKDSTEMSRYRAMMGDTAYLVAKLERDSAIGDDKGIAAIADELWLCRGDLGAELGVKALAEVVYHFSGRVGGFSVPVMLAGQVLEHMTAQPSPTRSEICYLYESLVRGYRGVVLSDETAIGSYPIESCRAAALFRG